MDNIRVRTAIERLSNEINSLAKHIASYSGIDSKDARFVDNIATDIAVTATQIAAMAREVEGNTSSKTVVTKVRKSLGFTSP
jgi:hypothetical protein